MSSKGRFATATILFGLLGVTMMRADIVFDTINSPEAFPSSEYDNFSGMITLGGEARFLTNVVFGCVYANLQGGDDFVSPSFTDTNGNTFFLSRPLALPRPEYGVQLTLADLTSPENPIPLTGAVPDTFTWSIGYSGTSSSPPWTPESEMFFFPTVGSIVVGSGEPTGYWYPYGDQEGIPYYLPVRFEATIPEPASGLLLTLGFVGWQLCLRAIWTRDKRRQWATA